MSNPIQVVAGPEMDAAVAEYVMGWTRTGDQDHTKPLHAVRHLTQPGRLPWTEDVVDWESKGPHPRLESPDGLRRVYFCGCGESDELPAYSRYIAAAWEVVEKARLQVTPCGRFWFAAIIPKFNEDYEQGRMLSTVRNERNSICVDEWLDGAGAETAPLAICMAALRSCGVEVVEPASQEAAK